MTHTAETLAALIRDRIEPSFADEVLDALRSREGQPIDNRLLDKLPGGRVEWRLNRIMGYTELKNRAYARTGGTGRTAISLVLARSEAPARLSVALIEHENPAYFADRHQRNQLRAAALTDAASLTRLAVVMDQLEVLNRQVAVVREQFIKLVEPLPPQDRYELERACGLRDR